MGNLNWPTIFYYFDIQVTFVLKTPYSGIKPLKIRRNQINFVLLHIESDTSIYGNLGKRKLHSVTNLHLFDISANFALKKTFPNLLSIGKFDTNFVLCWLHCTKISQSCTNFCTTTSFSDDLLNTIKLNYV